MVRNIYVIAGDLFAHKEQVVCLNATTGEEIWIHSETSRFEEPVAGAGPRGTPTFSDGLVHQGLVIVFTGVTDKAVVALKADTGELAWQGGSGALSYCSAQVSNVAGEDQILFCTDTGLLAFAPADGRLVWQHEWPTGGVARIVQPQVLNGDDLLIGTGLGVGLRRIHVTKSGDSFQRLKSGRRLAASPTSMTSSSWTIICMASTEPSTCASVSTKAT